MQHLLSSYCVLGSMLYFLSMYYQNISLKKAARLTTQMERVKLRDLKGPQAQSQDWQSCNMNPDLKILE